VGIRGLRRLAWALGIACRDGRTICRQETPEQSAEAELADGRAGGRAHPYLLVGGEWEDNVQIVSHIC